MNFHNFLLTYIILYDNVYLRGDKMIGKTLQNLLDEKGINVNELSKMINVSNQTLYSIIKRDNMKIDFEVLLKICKALNVSVEYFYSDYTNTMQTQFLLDEQEKKLVTAYRNKPEMQEAVNTLLGLNKPAAITDDSVVQDINFLSKANRQTTIEKK